MDKVIKLKDKVDALRKQRQEFRKKMELGKKKLAEALTALKIELEAGLAVLDKLIKELQEDK